MQATNVWDVIPADVCVNVILAAAAALASNAAHACAAAPLYSGKTAKQRLLQQQHQERDQVQRDQGQEQPLLILHCGSSTTYPLTIMESWNWGVEVYGE